jgi:Ser/Thr protein kinase RdoA (MazF antagonist)
MEERIRERYSDAILQEAMSRYGIDKDRIRLLDGFESYIYEFDRDDGEYVLRIAHSIRRNENLIRGEVDWINYLARGGASVARAVLSRRERLVEAIGDGRGGEFLATAFIRAKGLPPRKAGLTPELYRTYGQMLGRIHCLSKDYKPTDPAWKRPEWDDPAMMEIDRFVPASEPLVVERWKQLREHLAGLPKDRDSYGLIHQDAHGGNFLVDEDGRITLFDFDDCVYSWYVYDIAMVIFYLANGRDDAREYTRALLSHFMPAYLAENDLDARWMREIPSFLKLREIDLYALIHRSFDVENLDDTWCARYMDGRRERIEKGIAFADLQPDDFS